MTITRTLLTFAELAAVSVALVFNYATKPNAVPKKIIANEAAQAQLPLGITLSGKVIDVYDGDTVTFLPTPIPIRVRLIGVWAPEVTGVQKVEGIKSRDNLSGIALGKEAVLQVPFTGKTIGDITTLGRIKGKVFVDGKNVSTLQVKQGFASETKEDEFEEFGPAR